MAVSFSANAKSEMCRVFPQRACCALAESFGILLFCNSFSREGIRIITESREFAQFLPKLFKKAFNLSFDLFPSLEAPGKLVFQITNPDKLDVIMESCGFSLDRTLSLHVNLPVVENDCCKAAFLRGAFLAGGSVTDPEKGYHMEFVFDHEDMAEEFIQILKTFSIGAKMVLRKKNYVVYIKDGEEIVDMLNIMGAHISLMNLENTRIMKDMRNSINRILNCETANIAKTVNAATKQVEDIMLIQKLYGLHRLPDNLRQVAEVRLAYPEASLVELSQLMDPPVGKSGVNHRLRKLSELAERLRVN